jgi:hypothetical protein
MRRRAFIAGLSGVVALPLAARAQQGDRVRRISVLRTVNEIDPAPKSQGRWWRGRSRRPSRR